MTFEQFLKSNQKNAWVDGPKTLKLYVRRTPNNPYWLDHYGEIQLANMNAEKMGQGALTDFLNKWEPQFSIFIENVINTRLLGYFEKRGYTQVKSHPDLPCFLKMKNVN